MMKKRAIAIILAVALCVPLAASAVDVKPVSANESVLFYGGGSPSGIVRDTDGAYLITDTFNKVIWRVPTTGVAEVYVGTIGVADLSGEPIGGYNDAEFAKASFAEPWDIAPFLKGYLVTDTANHVVRYLVDGAVESAVGTGKSGYKDGRGLAAAFNRPTGLASDGHGVYIADTGNNVVRYLDEKGNVSSVALGLNSPTGLTYNYGALYIADTGSHRILKLEKGELSVVAGAEYAAGSDDAISGDYLDGSAAEARFASPTGVAVAADGSIFVADSGNGAIRRIKNGDVTTVMKSDADKGEPYPVSPRGLLAVGDSLFVCDTFSGVVFSPFAPFKDVKPSDWFSGVVNNVFRLGLMTGTSATTFEPNGTMTRAMAVTVLYRVAGEPVTRSDLAFEDVDSSLWYGEAVNWAAQSGIVLGDNGKFYPNANISRQDLAVILDRYLTYIDAPLAVTQQYIIFADEAQISDYAKNSIQTLFKLGVIGGVGNNTINPTGNASRAEAAAMFDRLVKLL
ncbi:MAG: S-layer homology domain-containing protein [Oscillospiraceae bacterium]|jgi:streptogramin lyase|nr:S-layer homology domain-containing protein [Oscillospiraceae bacterium]